MCHDLSLCEGSWIRFVEELHPELDRERTAVDVCMSTRRRSIASKCGRSRHFTLFHHLLSCGHWCSQKFSKIELSWNNMICKWQWNIKKYHVKPSSTALRCAKRHLGAFGIDLETETFPGDAGAGDAQVGAKGFQFGTPQDMPCETLKSQMELNLGYHCFLIWFNHDVGEKETADRLSTNSWVFCVRLPHPRDASHRSASVRGEGHTAGRLMLRTSVWRA